MKEILKYLRQNPGSALVIVSMVLLVACAFLLIGKKVEMAGVVGNWAYVFLAVGMVMNFIRLLKSK